MRAHHAIDRRRNAEEIKPARHAALSAPASGAPAAGWVQALEMRGDHLWAQVEWTERAAAMIRAGEYRFCSPVFTFNEPDRKTGRPSVCAIDSVALTNRPFIDGQRPIALTLSRQLEIPTMPEEMPPAAESPAEDAGALLAARLMAGAGFEDPGALLAALEANLDAVVSALKGSAPAAPAPAAAPAATPAPSAVPATGAALTAQVAALSKQIQEMAPELATLRAEALLNFYRQILTGDQTDNIMGCYRTGEAAAKRLITEDMAEDEMYAAVLAEFGTSMARKGCPYTDRTPASLVLEFGQLLHMYRSPQETKTLWQPPGSRA